MHVLAMATEPGGDGANEDRAGWIAASESQAGAAWVIDGATGLVDEPVLSGVPSDAAWYADVLDAGFRAAAPHRRPLDPDDDGAMQERAIARDAIISASTAWNAAVHMAGVRTAGVGNAGVGNAGDWNGRGEAALGSAEGGLAGPPEDAPPLPPYALPSAAALMLRWRRGDAGWALSWSGLADCTLLIRSDAGEVRCLHGRGVSQIERRLGAGIGPATVRASDAKTRLKALRDPLRAIRGTMNRPGGYWIYSIHPQAADHLDRGSLTVAGSGHLLLATDGFTRLIDTYGLHDQTSLMRVAAHSGLDPLMADLRAFEAADAACERAPRIKPRDDATAVLLRYA